VAVQNERLDRFHVKESMHQVSQDIQGGRILQVGQPGNNHHCVTQGSARSAWFGWCITDMHHMPGDATAKGSSYA
jgi:hypothetical protein